MNDVPYDESLMDSNDFMKTYWERSTENRNVAFVQDLRTDERVSDDFSELRSMSMGAFGSLEAEDEADDRIKDSLVAEVPAKDSSVIDNTFGSDDMPGLVEPKSVTITGSTVAIWLLAALLVLLGVLLYMTYRTSRQRQ
jgi:hypothetical protein